MKTLDELSMALKWKAGLERAKRGPSTKKRPVWARTTGKDVKKLKKQSDKLAPYLKATGVGDSPSAKYARYKDKAKKQGFAHMSFQDWLKRQ